MEAGTELSEFLIHRADLHRIATPLWSTATITRPEKLRNVGEPVTHATVTFLNRLKPLGFSEAIVERATDGRHSAHN